MRSDPNRINRRRRDLTITTYNQRRQISDGSSDKPHNNTPTCAKSLSIRLDIVLVLRHTSCTCSNSLYMSAWCDVYLAWHAHTLLFTTRCDTYHAWHAHTLLFTTWGAHWQVTYRWWYLHALPSFSSFICTPLLQTCLHSIGRDTYHKHRLEAKFSLHNGLSGHVSLGHDT